MELIDNMYVNSLRALELSNLKIIENEASLFSRKRVEKLKKSSITQTIKMAHNVFLSKRKFMQTKAYNSSVAKENRTREEFEKDLVCSSEYYKKKIAVYTCVVGGYDKVSDPTIINENIDYFIFSDHNIQSRIWNQISIPSQLLELGNNTLINRYLKFHPQELFDGYDYVIYVDGNVQVSSDITPLLKYTKNRLGVAFHSHGYRDSIYDEVEVLIKVVKRGDPDKLTKQIAGYRQEGFPDNYGLPEATIILTDLSNNMAITFFTQWWEEFLKSQSLRDQIALPYVLWKNGIATSEVTLLGNNLRNSSKFMVATHK
ncbi:DUF616 domain-containing protein [Enterococcus hulanensis]|uniref:DUF616 domain-containing protein n=1 Tax=Enterococcus hulanensis TaxID=2559929 RepID=A0ABU3EWP5_9ENTE|nr:glycosyltransferase domain-containing protein [Enterococcus hulanensis]MDT2599294.1 DUF616 domain-containing protein [Enterococcus hulanensis]MDT2608701.1 DUF616 domain-containing protein [Enterococcus hulanensis]MDT2616456.1 DUF616 domain-containing protein [Enterococcus hulanensis]MDT2627504.1 DUF616 domain-containing protein [Enterococcus hulanensis]MDT2655534.1 DUF616 domain-containing protein [Enterococcus hulanensis]